MSAKRTDERALPAAIDAERLVLGAALSGQREIIDAVTEDDFSSAAHRQIYHRMLDLHQEAKPTDRASVYHELARYGQVDSVGGLSYLVSLDDGMPMLYNAEGWVEILREQSRLRQIILQVDDIKQRAYGLEQTGSLIASLEQIGQALASSSRNKKTVKTFRDILDEIGINEFLKPQRTKGINAPYEWLRKAGFAFGWKTLTTVAAATSVGKSAFLRACCLHAALQGHKVLLYSLEVPADEVYRGWVAQLGSVNMQRLRAGQDGPGEVEDAYPTIERLLENGRLHVCDDGDVTVATMRQELTRAANSGDPYRMLAVDYLQQVTPLGKFSNTAEAVSSVSRGVKLITQSFGVAGIQAAQLNRRADQEQRAPRLSDILQSSSIEQDSNNVFLLHRKRADPHDEQWLLNVNLAKQRNGRLMEQDMWFTRRFARFDEIEMADQGGTWRATS